VLLSSLQGAAITGYQDEGAVHEFTSLPRGGRRCHRHRAQPERGHHPFIGLASRAPCDWTKDGAGKVTARDNPSAPEGIEILNPDRLIMTCSKGAKVRMEIEIATGRGYVPAERKQDADHGRRDRPHRFRCSRPSAR